jgi:hypothetical protein
VVLPVNPQALEKLNRAPAQAFPLVIQELTGDARVVTLRGRSLPYRGIGWGSELRVETKYFPGQPVAQAQVLGPKWTDTTMTGMWKDAFLFDDSSYVTLLGFPRVGSAGRPGSADRGGKSFQSGGAIPGGPGEARRARTVRDAIWLIQRSGQLLRVEWGSVVRFGFIASFDAEHDREEDIRWEITFKWIGDTDAAPKPIVRPKFDAPGLLARLISAIQAFLNEMNAALAQLFGAVQLVTQRITRIGTLLSDLIGTLSSVVSLLLLPAEIIGVIKQQITSIVLAVRDLLAALRSTPAAYAALRDGGNPNDANLASEAAAAIAFNAARLGVDVEATRDELEGLESPDIIGTFTAPEDVTLRDVSTQFYGTPENWTLIADFNNIAGSIAPRGTVLRIPSLETGQGGAGSG